MEIKKNERKYYFVFNRLEDEYGCIYIANSCRDARNRAWRSHRLEIDEFIHYASRKSIPDRPLPQKLPLGPLKNDWVGLFYGLYAYIYETCPYCKFEGMFKFDSETETQCICKKCKQEIKESDVIKWEKIKDRKDN
jgi:hypothetical protein